MPKFRKKPVVIEARRAVTSRSSRSHANAVVLGIAVVVLVAIGLICCAIADAGLGR